MKLTKEEIIEKIVDLMNDTGFNMDTPTDTCKFVGMVELASELLCEPSTDLGNEILKLYEQEEK